MLVPRGEKRKQQKKKKKERAKKKKPHKQNTLFQHVVKTLETKQNTLFQKKNKNINKRNIPFVQWFTKNFIHALQFGWVGAEGNDPFSTLRWVVGGNGFGVRGLSRDCQLGRSP